MFIYNLEIQPDGKLVFGGNVQSKPEPATANTAFVYRTIANGFIDNSFGSGGKLFATPQCFTSGLSNLCIQPDGKILMGYRTVNISKGYVLRATVNGKVDSSFCNNGILTVMDTAFINEIQFWDNKFVVVRVISSSITLQRFKVDSISFNTGIADQNPNLYTVYPTVFNQSFFIACNTSFDDQLVSDIDLFTLSGEKILLSVQRFGNGILVSVPSMLAEGNYILRMKNRKGFKAAVLTKKKLRVFILIFLLLLFLKNAYGRGMRMSRNRTMRMSGFFGEGLQVSSRLLIDVQLVYE
jgi:hypothetical protein